MHSQAEIFFLSLQKMVGKNHSQRFQWENDEQVLYFWQQLEFHENENVLCMIIMHRKLLPMDKEKGNRREIDGRGGPKQTK